MIIAAIMHPPERTKEKYSSFNFKLIITGKEFIFCVFKPEMLRRRRHVALITPTITARGRYHVSHCTLQ